VTALLLLYCCFTALTAALLLLPMRLSRLFRGGRKEVGVVAVAAVKHQ
jgi:hypothetical protein